MKARPIFNRSETKEYREREFVAGILYVCSSTIGSFGKDWIGSHAWRDNDEYINVIRRNGHFTRSLQGDTFFGESFRFKRSSTKSLSYIRDGQLKIAYF